MTALICLLSSFESNKSKSSEVPGIVQNKATFWISLNTLSHSARPVAMDVMSSKAAGENHRVKTAKENCLLQLGVPRLPQ